MRYDFPFLIVVGFHLACGLAIGEQSKSIRIDPLDECKSWPRMFGVNCWYVVLEIPWKEKHIAETNQIISTSSDWLTRFASSTNYKYYAMAARKEKAEATKACCAPTRCLERALCYIDSFILFFILILVFVIVRWLVTFFRFIVFLVPLFRFIVFFVPLFRLLLLLIRAIF